VGIMINIVRILLITQESVDEFDFSPATNRPILVLMIRIMIRIQEFLNGIFTTTG